MYILTCKYTTDTQIYLSFSLYVYIYIYIYQMPSTGWAVGILLPFCRFWLRTFKLITNINEYEDTNIII